MKKFTNQEKTESLQYLQSLVKEGDTVHFIIRQVSPSGMYRHIDFYKFTPNEKGGIEKYWLSYHMARALGYPFKSKTEAIGVSGCGMDMGFSVICNLGYALFDDYKKLQSAQL